LVADAYLETVRRGVIDGLHVGDLSGAIGGQQLGHLTGVIEESRAGGRSRRGVPANLASNPWRSFCPQRDFCAIFQGIGQNELHKISRE